MPPRRPTSKHCAGRGHRIVEPDSGYLACGMTGPGRLAELEQIVEAISFETRKRRDLDDETVLITAGPTQEPIDPVRFLSNRSSGKMGYALAEAAAARGARVILISGPVNLTPPSGVETIPVRTAAEMRDRVFARLASATMVVKAAAVADFHVANPSDRKIKKTAARLSLELDPTVDILAELGRKKGDRLLIGFAAETQNLQQEARRKLESKNCDMVVGNLVGGADSAFESDQNEVTLALSTGEDISATARPQTRSSRPHFRRSAQATAGLACPSTLTRSGNGWNSIRISGSKRSTDSPATIGWRRKRPPHNISAGSSSACARQ